MGSPKPSHLETVLFTAFSLSFVYVMSLGIGTFDNCHKDNKDDEDYDKLLMRKDYMAHLLTICITVPATLCARSFFDGMTGSGKSSMPLFGIAMGVLTFVGSYFAYEIMSKEVTGTVSEVEVWKRKSTDDPDTEDAVLATEGGYSLNPDTDRFEKTMQVDIEESSHCSTEASKQNTYISWAGMAGGIMLFLWGGYQLAQNTGFRPYPPHSTSVASVPSSG